MRFFKYCEKITLNQKEKEKEEGIRFSSADIISICYILSLKIKSTSCLSDKKWLYVLYRFCKSVEKIMTMAKKMFKWKTGSGGTLFWQTCGFQNPRYIRLNADYALPKKDMDKTTDTCRTRCTSHDRLTFIFVLWKN